MKFLIVFFILLKFVILKKDLYKIHFIKVKGLWYCDIPYWPKGFFDNAQMIAGAGRLLEHLCKGRDEVTLEVGFDEKHLPLPVNHYNRGHKTGSALTRGFFMVLLHMIFRATYGYVPLHCSY